MPHFYIRLWLFIQFKAENVVDRECWRGVGALMVQCASTHHLIPNWWIFMRSFFCKRVYSDFRSDVFRRSNGVLSVRANESDYRSATSSWPFRRPHTCTARDLCEAMRWLVSPHRLLIVGLLSLLQREGTGWAVAYLRGHWVMALQDFLVPKCRLKRRLTGYYCYLIFRKITKFVATRRQILRLKCTKFNCAGACPRARWGSLQCSPGP